MIKYNQYKKPKHENILKKIKSMNEQQQNQFLESRITKAVNQYLNRVGLILQNKRQKHDVKIFVLDYEQKPATELKPFNILQFKGQRILIKDKIKTAKRNGFFIKIKYNNRTEFIKKLFID